MARATLATHATHTTGSLHEPSPRPCTTTHRSGEMHKVLESVFSELTVMGFIGLVIFTTDKVR